MKGFLLYLFILFNTLLFSQARLVINNNPYLVMRGGIYLVLANSNPNAITSMSGGVPSSNYIDGRIISEEENNKVKWFANASTGDYIIPFYYSTAMVPFRFNITIAGTEAVAGSAYFSASTWFTSANTIWPTGTSLCGLATENDVMDRFWVIDCGASSGYSANPTATMRLYYRETAVNTFEGETVAFFEADYQAQRWNSALGGTCKWEVPPVGTDVPANNYVEVIGINSFSPWALANKIQHLPVELFNFSGDCSNGNVILHWTTVSEINNDFFEIQKSTDVQNWITIGQVRGAGNSNSTINYQFSDSLNNTNLIETEKYYRLLQHDFDGVIALYNPVGINCKNEKTENAFENIQIIFKTDEILVSLNSKEKSSVYLNLVDVLGRILYTKKYNFSNSGETVIIKTEQLPKGIYYLTLRENNILYTKKIFL